MCEVALYSWIPLGLHLDQSKYMGWMGPCVQRNSSYEISRNSKYNSVFEIPIYVQAVLHKN